MNKCLHCYNALTAGEIDFHPKCSRKFFGTVNPPEITFTLPEVMDYAVHELGKRVSVTGMQPKITLETQRSAKKTQRFTITGVRGDFILKPPVEQIPEMTEIEDLTMHLAQLLKMKTAEHSLIRLKSGELAYITKRFDRTKTGGKIPVEDMAQLTDRLAENKYRGSMEKIGKVIKQYSSYPIFDLIKLYEFTLFTFITGNADMHLKNISLLTNENNEITMAPAYDLISTKLLIPNDTEELALPINGKKSRLKNMDFDKFAESLGIDTAGIRKIHKRFADKLGSMHTLINKSFLSPDTKNRYKALMEERINRIVI